MTIEVDLADSMVVSNEDIIDKEGKKVCIRHTVEIGVYVKLRLMPSDYLTCYFVIKYNYYTYNKELLAIIRYFKN